jgi:hypothetical protein
MVNLVKPKHVVAITSEEEKNNFALTDHNCLINYTHATGSKSPQYPRFVITTVTTILIHTQLTAIAVKQTA